MASANDNRQQTRAAAAEGMRAGRERTMFNRKLQKETRTQNMEEREAYSRSQMPVLNPMPGIQNSGTTTAIAAEASDTTMVTKMMRTR